MELVGRVALVTGAGSGIGHAIAECFAREGAAVAINYFGYEKQAQELAEALGGANPGVQPRAIAIKADVSRADDVSAMVARVVAELGGLDILVNNAGIEAPAPFLEIEEADWDRMLGIDLKGAFLCAQAGARVMRSRGGGSIVNISSIHEDVAFPGFAPYSAAKGGLRMLMRNMAVELAGDRIRVNNVAPGAIETPINQETLRDPEKMAALKRMVPLGRMGTAAEVAQVALFLASDRASYVTGSTYYVDGGMVRRSESL